MKQLLILVPAILPPPPEAPGPKPPEVLSAVEKPLEQAAGQARRWKPSKHKFSCCEYLYRHDGKLISFRNRDDGFVVFLLSVISLTFVLSPVRERMIDSLSQRATSEQDGISVILALHVNT